MIVQNKNILIDKLKLKIYRFEKIGSNVRILGDFSFFNTRNIIFEDNIFIAREAYFDAIGPIIIKSGTMIGPRFTCISGNHYYDGNDLKAIPYDQRLIKEPVIINENVWIGSCVSIAPGVEIGEGAIIGMGCVVNKDVPKYSIVVGNPMKIIKQRDMNVYNRLKKQDAIYNKVFAGKGFIYIDRDNKNV
jgi:acetyltransferase-like isoleucine patch superfamily enzyme